MTSTYIVQSMTRRYHFRLKGHEKKVFVFYSLHGNKIKLYLKSYYFIFFLLHRMNCLKKQRMRFLMKS